MDRLFGDGSVWYGYNGKPWIFSGSRTDEFFFDSLPVRRPLKSLHEEVNQAAQEAVDFYQGEEIHVFFSGGSDSEVMLNAFRQTNAKVRAIILADKQGLNARELANAQRYMDKTQFSNVDVVTFDFRDWVYSQDCVSLANQVQCDFGGFTLLYRPLLEKYRNKITFVGNGDGSFAKMRGIWHVYEKEMDYTLFKFYLFHNLKGMPSFYKWSTEVNTAWAAHPFFDSNLKEGTKRGIHTDHDPRLKADFMTAAFSIEDKPKIDWIEPLSRWRRQNSPYKREWYMPRTEWLAKQLLDIELGEPNG